MEKPPVTTCSICARELQPGRLGLLLRGQLICRDCEDRLVSLKVTDREYPWYMEKIKKIVFS